MRCPRCRGQVTEQANYCSECGHPLRAAEEGPAWDPVEAARRSKEEDPTIRSAEAGLFKPLPGFSRTLSAELARRQDELSMVRELNALVESRSYKPGEVIIGKGETTRDLFFFTEGRVEISKQEEGGDLILNELEPPYILGEIAFLLGSPRTANVRAKTDVKGFTLKYENFLKLSREFPGWLHPLLTSFVTGIKSLHFKNSQLENRLKELTEASDSKDEP